MGWRRGGGVEGWRGGGVEGINHIAEPTTFASVSRGSVISRDVIRFDPNLIFY